ncbi:TadE/TadG family type IV pilus assembly protein [Iodidimonas sp. SYSU 1G8]|uniref:TadE/TadG family type IV pilus assembly protein n=1 Tax=Iodidimonas sp. SYSU 1G8 TaxID=3133967 RepID=UPI0031FE9093
MVEFALVIGPFCILVMGVIELGLAFWANSLLDSATQETARKIRTGQIQAAAAEEDAPTADELFKTELCGTLKVLLKCDSSRLAYDVRESTSFGTVDLSPPPTDEEAGVVITQFQPGTRDEVILVRTYYKWGLITPGMRRLLSNHTDADGNLLLSSTVAFRNEPFPEIASSEE